MCIGSNNLGRKTSMKIEVAINGLGGRLDSVIVDASTAKDESTAIHAALRSLLHDAVLSVGDTITFTQIEE